MNEWRDFFDGYASQYMDEVFVTGTLGEVDFIARELDLPAGARILDVGCGTGRHAVELARRGYRVTGVDQSQGMLDEAARAAAAAGVETALEWVRADAVDLRWQGEPFDAAICLCEGAFTLLGANDDPIEHDAGILRSIHAVLKPGARLVLTALSAVRRLRELTTEDLAAGAFDLETMVESEAFTWTGPEGERTFVGRQRMYVPTELVLLVRQAGFAVEHVGGGTAGAFARRPLEIGEMEIMVIARRPDGAEASRVHAAPQGLRVRPVTPDDAEGVARVLNEVIVDGRHSLLDTPFSVEAEREYIAAFPVGGVFNVAELDGAGIVAVQSLEPLSRYSTHAHDHVLTMGTWVSEPFRRRGIASRLADVSFAAARESGFEKVFTDIRADNSPSLAFHLALGFTIVGTARRQARVADRYVDVVFVERFL